MSSLLPGFLTGLVLIVAIGAQNAFVLRQGLRREHVGVVVTLCALSDVVLILTGVAGLGRLLEYAPWFVDVARWGGAAFLLAYGLMAARRVVTPHAEGLDVEAGAFAEEGEPGAVRTHTRPRVAVAATALALTWLNPHVYLDTVVLLGSVAATHGEQRWWFGWGAVAGSVVWFTALGYGAGRLGRWLQGPRAWRAIDACVAMLMVVFAVKLVLG